MKKENDGKYVNDLLLLYLIFFISILEMWKTASDVGMLEGVGVWEQKNQLWRMKGEAGDEDIYIYVFLFFSSYTRHIRYNCDTKVDQPTQDVLFQEHL